MTRPLTRRVWPRIAAMITVLLTAAAALPRAQNVAAPAAVPWPTPPLPDGPIALQSAEVRDFRVVALSKTLDQPWSLGFLPNGDMLVTERPGRIRLFHNGVLRREPLLRELHQRIRDVRQGPDGLLYVLTGENPGAVLRLEPVGATTTR